MPGGDTENAFKAWIKKSSKNVHQFFKGFLKILVDTNSIAVACYTYVEKTTAAEKPNARLCNPTCYEFTLPFQGNTTSFTRCEVEFVKKGTRCSENTEFEAFVADTISKIDINKGIVQKCWTWDKTNGTSIRQFYIYKNKEGVPEPTFHKVCSEPDGWLVSNAVAKLL